MKKRLISVLSVIALLMCTFTFYVGAVGDVIDFTRESLDLYVGQSYQLSLKNDVSVVSYSSSDPKIVAVSSDGMVNALATGSSVITVKDMDGNEAHCSVNVLSGKSPTSVVLETQSISMTEGESRTLKASVTPSDLDDTRVYFASSDESVAKVDKNGYIKAIKAGVAVITVESSSAAVASKCIVKVTSKSGNNNFSVSIDGVLYSIAGEKKVKMIVELTNATAFFDTTTDENGKFSFDDIVQGTYTLSVYNSKKNNKPLASSQISVGAYDMKISAIINEGELVILYQNETAGSDKVKDITLEKSRLTLDTGTTYDMAFKVVPSSAALPVINGVSSDENVVTVDADGRITANEEGTATITFTTADGRIAKQCQVVVTSMNSNTFSWVIILLETLIVLLIVIMFVVSYHRFMKQKERAEGLFDD